ncbi:tRNA (adenosine(37)-N6)-threonylcarbamoyltransferase complex dimerization subunit type 1 TsaB [Bacterioplanes sanyensis]|nr:tRNA (adenosine(37)-N6)-threonylcarbamoyltransferase complex dimerization subunit type 1 TsaB [Bacterioplanes sanyensis]
MHEHQPRKHAQRLLPMVEELLSSNGVYRDQLTAIAYGRGPGSFTGIRIAAAVTQGIAMALDLPVAGISTLQALAQKTLQSPGEQCIAVLDAHMGEVFWAPYQYNNGLAQPMAPERVCSPADFLAHAEADMPAVGNGLALNELCHWPGNADQVLLAEDMAPLVEYAWQQQQFGDIELHAPVYLRDGVAWKKLAEQPSLLRR